MVRDLRRSSGRSSGRGVHVCPAGLTWGQAVELKRKGGIVRPPFREFRQDDLLAFVPKTVLCWVCRNYHSPAGVIECMAKPKLAAPTGESISSSSNVLDAGPLKPFSELWEFLTDNAYSDGSKRRPGKLSLSCESGSLGLCLTDGDTGQYAFLNGNDLELLLMQLEERLKDNSLSFRTSKFGGKKK